MGRGALIGGRIHCFRGAKQRKGWLTVDFIDRAIEVLQQTWNTNTFKSSDLPNKPGMTANRWFVEPTSKPRLCITPTSRAFSMPPSLALD